MIARSPSLCAVSLMLSLLLVGCGQAGPLYLPEEEETTEQEQVPAAEETSEDAAAPVAND